MKALTLTQQALDLLGARRVFDAPWWGRRWKVGDRLVLHDETALEPYCNILAGDALPLAMGAFSYSHSPLRGAVAIGRYCSIAAGLELMGPNHPMDWASTSSAMFDRGTLQGVSAYFRDQDKVPTPHPFTAPDPTVRIGHDVWIGAGVMIAPGVTIGDGAVIGARSLVLRDVPPYAIAYGSPAKVVRYRFDEETVARLQGLRWWRFAPDVLQGLPAPDPQRFADELEALIAASPPPEIRPIRLTGAELLSACGEVSLHQRTG